jgi:diguanylate cyclase (GGDEF)-like protein
MQDGVVREADVFLHHADGHRVPVLVRAAPIRDVEGNIIGAVEIFSSDAGMRTVRQQIRELRNITNVDPLTKLGNRQFINGRLRAVLAEYKDQEGGAAVLFMDIDKFKQVNDTYGHDIGDKVLCMVAATLKNGLRNTDAVGRWGGEEFVAILDDVNSLESLNFICEKLRKLVGFSSLDHLDERISVTVSIGATFLKPNDTPESLVQRSDALMYQSKQAGRNRFTIG